MSLSLAAKAGSRDRLEGAQAIRLQVVRPSDALHRAQREPHGLGHRPAGPMDRLMRRFGAGQRHHPGRRIRRDRRFAGLAGLVAQQTRDPASKMVQPVCSSPWATPMIWRQRCGGRIRTGKRCASWEPMPGGSIRRGTHPQLTFDNWHLRRGCRAEPVCACRLGFPCFLASLA
jgi:hypothetical protein